jgi:hypothetical protein
MKPCFYSNAVFSVALSIRVRVKSINAMHLMVIACFKGFICCTKPVVGSLNVFNNISLHKDTNFAPQSALCVLM